MEMSKKILVLDDTQYEIDSFYLEGVAAFQQSIPWACNPYKDRSHRYSQWEYGHTNESALPGHVKDFVKSR